MTFQFATAARIIFGAGSSFQIPAIAAEFGSSVLLVRGSSEARTAALADACRKAGLVVAEFAVVGEPTIAMIDDGVEAARAVGAEVIVACGGGSVVDAGKAIAGLATNPGGALRYLEVIGEGQPLGRDPLPVIAVPTTAGTGAEVTSNAVLKSPEHAVKVSLRHRLMLPQAAVIDPDLTATLPQSVIASTGLDAFTQCLEPYLSRFANPLTDLFALEGMKRAARSLRRVYDDPADADAREDMAMASLCGGLALANAKLGAVHGFAGPLGGMTSAPHGLICARLLPFATAANIKAMDERAPKLQARRRCDELGPLLTGRAEANATDALGWIESLCDALRVPGLRQFGLSEAQIPEAVAKAARSSSMKGNPLELTENELARILAAAL